MEQDNNDAARSGLERAIEEFAAASYKTRMMKRAEELHAQIASIIRREDAILALGVLRLIQHQIAEKLLKSGS